MLEFAIFPSLSVIYHSLFHGRFLACVQVQTGFGRLGSHYWGFEAQGVTPDIGENYEMSSFLFLYY